MTLTQRKALILAAWAGMVLTAGLALGIDKPASWAVLGSLAVIPAAIGNRLWDVPEMTLSQIIVRARSRS